VDPKPSHDEACYLVEAISSDEANQRPPSLVTVLTLDSDKISRVRAAVRSLQALGFRDDVVARWFGVPLVTDARYVPSSVRRSQRRGVGGWIALLVGGEEVPEADLVVLEEADRAALVEAGLVERAGGRLRARVALVPILGLLLASDRIDAAGADAVVVPDISALNLAASLPPNAPDARVRDVGGGAGILSHRGARAGARAEGSDLDARALAAARLNAELNGLSARFREADLLAGADGRYQLITFNAPLLRAAMVESDPAASSRYYAAPRGEELALAFLAALPPHLSDDGEALVHVQLTPAVDRALDALAAERPVLSVRFAEAPDGTPHAMVVMRGSGPPERRRARVPLSPVCPHVSRRILDALAAPRVLVDEVTPLPAPWLELRQSRQLVPPGAPAWRALRFGATTIDDGELALLERLQGQPLGALALDGDDRARLMRLVDLGLVILG
jgi:methylase of polypeptide subunit release factors